MHFNINFTKKGTKRMNLKWTIFTKTSGDPLPEFGSSAGIIPIPILPFCSVPCESVLIELYHLEKGFYMLD